VVKIDLRIDLFTYLFIFWTVPKSYKSIGGGGSKMWTITQSGLTYFLATLYRSLKLIGSIYSIVAHIVSGF